MPFYRSSKSKNLTTTRISKNSKFYRPVSNFQYLPETATLHGKTLEINSIFEDI